MSLTPERVAQQHVSPMIDTDTGQIVGVAYSGNTDRILTRWKPEQADELEAIGRLMIELAEQLRETARAA